MATVGASVTEVEARALREDGVVPLRRLLDDRWLAECESAWRWSLEHPGPLASWLLGTDDARQDLCNPAAPARYRDLLEGSPIADAIAALWDAPDVWFMYEQVFHKTRGVSGRTPWHQDSPYLAVGGEQLAVVWIPFEALAREHALEFVRASHRGPLYDGSRFDPGDPTAPLYGTGELPRLPDIEAERERWDIVGWAVEPGDVVVFHPAMLHGGAPTDARLRERRTLSLRFFGERAHYERRPGPAGPAVSGLHGRLRDGDPFRAEAFLRLRGAAA
jgi:ectoine hydroxylase-related dioxygenase (phytanoyl-CoA dioxygenase family)